MTGRTQPFFGRDGDGIEPREFAERRRDDRHHLRFIISPGGVAEMMDLRAFAQDLVAHMEKDLGTTLDWVAIDH